MKDSRFLVIAIVMAMAGTGMAQEFVHPGIPLTKSDLETLKANLTSEPWKSGYAALAADGHSQLSYKMQGPFAQVSRNPHKNRNQWKNDMQAVFNLACMWYFTGNQAYAQKSHDILIAWATTQTSFEGMEANLDLGDFAYRFGGGADILRGTWPGWTAADTKAVKALFNNVYWPASGADADFLGPANKGMLTLAAGTAIAVFSDDQPKLDHILYLFRTGPSAALMNTLASGEIGESARDQGHAYGQLVSMAFVGETLWKQGIDVYSEMDNRLLACGEYSARFNLGVNTPYVPFGTTDALYLTNDTLSWPHGRMAMNLLINAYENRKGLTAPYMEQRRDSLSVDMESFMFEKTADSSTAMPPGPLTLPTFASVTRGLSDLDVGASPAGSSAYSDGVWTVKGAGSDIWTHGDDSFHFTYKQVEGDCTILAKVTSVQNTAANAKAAVMIRDSLSPNAARAWIGITPSRKFESYMHGWSNIRGGSNWEKPSREIPQSSYWVKLERVGNMITTYTSPDGVSWAAAGLGQFSKMGNTAYIGLAVCSRAEGTLNTSTFSHLCMTGGDGDEAPKVPAPPFAVYASPGNKQVPLHWLESFEATSYSVKRATTSGGPYSNIAAVKSTSYVDTTVNNGESYFYAVSASNAAGESGNSLEDRVTPQAHAAVTVK